jgi:hypothetical protein
VADVAVDPQELLEERAPVVRLHDLLGIHVLGL